MLRDSHTPEHLTWVKAAIGRFGFHAERWVMFLAGRGDHLAATVAIIDLFVGWMFVFSGLTGLAIVMVTSAARGMVRMAQQATR